MLGKRQESLIKNTRNEHQRFALRKYSIGVVSVLIGLAFFGLKTTTVQAADHVQQPETEKVAAQERPTASQIENEGG